MATPVGKCLVCFLLLLLACAFSALTHRLGVRKSIRPVRKLSDEVLAWLSVWSEVQMICIWSSCCHCHPIISCCSKIQNGLTFLVPAYPGCPGKETIKRLSVCLLLVATTATQLTRPPVSLLCMRCCVLGAGAAVGQAVSRDEQRRHLSVKPVSRADGT